MVGVGGPKSVACGGGADSMFQFQLERRGNGTKCCQKMKRRQRARLNLMGRKRDTERLTGPRNKENPRNRFSWYNWTVKI
jgi:hypothetical protein